MFKYRNISDFRQSMVLDGKRVLLKPDDVIESSTEIKSAFLELVESDTPITATLFELKKNPSNDDVQELKNMLKVLDEKYEKVISSIGRKLEMLKGAIKTVENEVFREEEPKKK